MARKQEKSNKEKEKDPYEFIYVKHIKCGRIWRVTRNSFNILWCPYCKTSNKFVEVQK